MALAAQLDPLLWPWLLIAGPAATAAVLWWRVGRVGLVLAALAALALGGARYVSTLPTPDATVAALAGSDIVAYGRISAEPTVRDSRLDLRVTLERVVADGQTRTVDETILVRAPRYPLRPYGATVRLVGELHNFAAADPSGYIAYLARQGIRHEMAYPQISVVASGGGIGDVLMRIKERARLSIQRSLPEPQASLLVGILLGDDSGMTRELADAFRRTGMTHIIAISGFNIALLMALADRLAAPLLPRRTAAVVIMVFIAVYTVLVGGAASVVRAALMGGVYLLSMRFLGRPTLALASLLLTAVIMTAVHPATLWDVGFQLSFAATLGLMLYAGPWTRRLEQSAGRPVARLVGEGLVVTAAAQVLALPLILYYFGQLSLASLPANLLVLPAQPGVMISGGVTAVSGMVVPLLGQMAGWVSWLFLAYTTDIITLLAALPYASVPLRLGGAGLAGVYGLVAVATVAASQRPKTDQPLVTASRLRVRQYGLLGASLVAALLAGLWATTGPDGRLHVSFLDVGQGDAILIESPAGHQVLVDGGRYPTAVLNELGRHVPFWDHTLDVVVATHPDEDHIAGLVPVLERYQVEMLVTNGAPADNDAAYAALLATAAARGTQIHVASPGETLALGGATLTILHPDDGFESDGTNGRSIVARLAYGDLSVLLTGDAEEAAEQWLLRSDVPLASTVLKAGHHGSNGSSSAPFLNAVRPMVAIISAGRDNSFGHPHPDVLARLEAAGAQVLRTDEMGTIALSSDGKTMWWEVERE
jgi:competence protein ComEC